MKITSLAFVVVVLALVPLWADPGYLAKADRLSFLDKNQQSIALLEAKLPTVTAPKARAEIYWRLARGTFDVANAGQDATGSGRPYLALYERSENYANKAIELDPTGAKGYYWKAACVGVIAQIHNLIRAFLSAGTVRDLLFKAARLDPSDGEIWYVLGQIYSQIPGFPLSFGNTAYAVSLGRKGLRARMTQVERGTEPNVPEDYYIELARELSRRNWSEAERKREQPQEAREYRTTTNPVTKNFYYEGVVQIPNLSDHAEAIRIEKSVVARLESLRHRTQTQAYDLSNARHDLRQWSH